jgi:hypothetical protein
MVKLGWLNERRVVAWSRVLAAAWVGLWGAWVVASRSGVTPAGETLGSDFGAHWVAGRLAWTEPLAAWDFDRVLALERTLAPKACACPWAYAPPMLLVVGALAKLPYVAALVVWVGASTAALAWIVRSIVPHPAAAWGAIAFPAIAVNAMHGQTGCLTAVLLAGGLAAAPTRAWAAGALLGTLSVKPHFFGVALVLLAAGGRWRTVAWTLAAALAWSGAATAAFGSDAWSAFARAAGAMRAHLEAGDVKLHKMPTIFAAARLAGASARAAWAFHAGGAACALYVAAAAWWRSRSAGAPASLRAAPLALAAAATATLLVTPFAYDYDLAMLAPCVVALAWDGRRAPLGAGEKAWLAAACLLPAPIPWLAEATRLQPGPIVLAALLLIAARRMRAATTPGGST